MVRRGLTRFMWLILTQTEDCIGNSVHFATGNRRTIVMEWPDSVQPAALRSGNAVYRAARSRQGRLKVAVPFVRKSSPGSQGCRASGARGHDGDSNPALPGWA